jgi:uncharacterized protein (DUF2147 family)
MTVRRSRFLPAAAAVALLAALWGAPGRAASEVSPEGYWLTKGYLVHITRCGPAFCGQLAGLRTSNRPDSARLDSRNKDSSKRSRPLCGIALFGDFRPSPREAGKWEGGWIYNPDDGRTYSSEARLQSPDRLKVRGYIGLPLIGRDLILVRAQEPAPRCAA